MRTRPAAALAFGLCLSAAVPNAHAEEGPAYPPCDKTPTGSDVAGAKGAFQAGQASFEEADYALAIDYWQDAYRRDCTAHALLLNLARAYELHGRKEAALTALTTYLERVPTTPDRVKLEKRVEVLRRQLESERPASPPAEPPAPASQDVAPQRDAVSPAQEVQAEVAAELPRGDRPIWPLFIAGAGGAIAVTGAVLYFPAKSELEKAEDSCPTRSECTNTNIAQANNAVLRRDISLGLAIGGAALLGAGLTWYFLSSPSAPAEPKSSRFTPLVSPQFAGLSFEKSF